MFEDKYILLFASPDWRDLGRQPQVSLLTCEKYSGFYQIQIWVGTSLNQWTIAIRWRVRSSRGQIGHLLGRWLSCSARWSYSSNHLGIVIDFCNFLPLFKDLHLDESIICSFFFFCSLPFSLFRCSHFIHNFDLGRPIPVICEGRFGQPSSFVLSVWLGRTTSC